MNIQTEKLEILKMILETENPQILESIKNLFAKEGKGDFWDSLTNEQKREIELGISEVEKGEAVDYETVMQRDIDDRFL